MTSESDHELMGKAAIVTGGARNIGRAIGKALASRGTSVAVAVIDIDGGRSSKA